MSQGGRQGGEGVEAQVEKAVEQGAFRWYLHNQHETSLLPCAADKHRGNWAMALQFRKCRQHFKPTPSFSAFLHLAAATSQEKR